MTTKTEMYTITAGMSQVDENWGVKNAYMMAVAMAASLPGVLAYIIFQRRITQAIMLTSGIKG